ncbi:unnamed protein product [Lactuca virosa]|uniref:Uncharacterized protein n=1 Tax=Lactuca virosa TaxID=75947 RepID=A0AAU9MJ78_9ASTR|nr:unnamed protein product [Lactuca virosa]
MDFQKKRIQFLSFIVGVIVLSFTAEKCRQMVGETGSSQSGKFTIFNCLDGGSGTLACIVKESVKLYTYNIRTLHVEVARNKAIEASLADAISQGMEAKRCKQAQKDGAKAAKMATRKAKRIIGPIISSGWDFFEAIYYGGTVTEGFLRGTGTLFGTYFVGYLGEERFGRFGYLVGSQFGSWIGGRIGLMVYDVANGVHFLLGFGQFEENVGQREENVGQMEEIVVNWRKVLVKMGMGVRFLKWSWVMWVRICLKNLKCLRRLMFLKLRFMRALSQLKNFDEVIVDLKFY